MKRWTGTALSGVLLSAIVSGCGQQGPVEGEQSAALPSGVHRPNTGYNDFWHNLGDFIIQEEPYEIRVSVGPFEEDDLRPLPPAKVAFLDRAGLVLVDWSFLGGDAFVVRNHVLFRASQRRLNFVTDEEKYRTPPNGNFLVAFDLRDAGRELWRTEFPVPTPHRYPAFEAVTEEIELALKGNDLILTVRPIWGPVAEYAVDQETGSIGEPRVPGRESGGR